MKKNILIITLLFTSITTYSQIGINTSNPKATLDINGIPDDANKPDGILIPRLSASQLKNKTYTNEHQGTLVYVTEIFTNQDDASGQVEDVNVIGLHEFDGTKWHRLKYTDDTLYDVNAKGNYAGRFISFTNNNNINEGTRESSLGYNSNTQSFYFGNMNPDHTGTDNISIGYNALENITDSKGNVAIGNYAYNRKTFDEQTGNSNRDPISNTGVGFQTGQNYIGSTSVSLGYKALDSPIDGEQNTAIGVYSLADATGSLYNSNNTAIGASSLRYAENPHGNIAIGRETGMRLSGTNNIIIGNAVASSPEGETITLNNKLLIHNHRLNDQGELAEPNVGINTLIYGDFNERWLRINGQLRLNPSNNNSTADSTYTKQVLYNPTTGELGMSNYTKIPVPPITGTYVLKLTDGVLQWVAE